MRTHWTERLSAYHDGELPPGEHASCEAHLVACADCRDTLAQLGLVIASARADRDTMPAVDLWPGILAKIDSGSANVEPRNRLWGQASAAKAPADRRSFSKGWSAWPRRQITFSLPQLALAASLLIAVSAAVAYVAAHRAVGPQPIATIARELPIQAMAEPMLAPSTDVTPANFADAAFDRAVSDLERTLVEQRAALDPRTIVIIERNLAVIDEAIRQARAALDADPANTFLNSHLADARRRKLELLRRATSIAGD
jgi:negative regulator of sigma E activity